MTWARIDDRFHGNPKVLRAWHTEPAAVGLYVMGITYCAQHETDGLVHDWFVLSLLPAKTAREKSVRCLVQAKLWAPVDDGWEIPDYLEFNPSHEYLEERRTTERERRKAARRSQRDRTLHATPAQRVADVIDPVPARPVEVGSVLPKGSPLRGSGMSDAGARPHTAASGVA